MNPYCIKCLKITNNSTSIELKYGTDRISRLYSNCTDCSFKKITAADRKDLNHYLRKLSVKEKLHYYLLKDFDRKLN